MVLGMNTASLKKDRFEEMQEKYLTNTCFQSVALAPLVAASCIDVEYGD